jgi:1-acyl-sn-glycerol-3-phosphate acyltransferase
MSAEVDRVYRIVMRLGAGLFRILDLRREPHGEQHIPSAGGAVLAISHFGYLDFALVQQVVWRRTHRLVRFLVTDAAFAHPIAGPFLRAMRHIPVNRRAGAGAFRSAERALGRGELVGVFPESAVSLADELLPFKPGAAALAARTGVPVIPVVVWGGQQVMTKGRPLRFRRARHARIHLEFGEPLRFLHTGSGAKELDAGEVTAELRAVMSAMVARKAALAPGGQFSG